MHKQTKRLYECGPFLLDPENQVLARDGEPVPLPPKAFETLLLLIEERGRLLEKERLLRAVWPDTYVEENNLTQYVSLLRKVLGDNAGDQQYIETVPKRGYRFVAPVRELVRNDGGLILTRNLRARIVVRQEEEEITTEGTSEEVKAANSPSIGALVSHLATPKFAATLLTILVATAAAYWGLPRKAKSPAPVAVQQRRSVAVLGFHNLSGKAESEWISTALAEMLTTELGAGERIRTVPGEDVARLRTDLRLSDSDTLSKATLAQIRKMLGADIAISGSFVELEPGPGGQFRLDLTLQDTNAGETVASFAETGTEADLFQLVARAGAKLRSKLGSPGTSDSEEAEFRAAFPATPEAERLYAQGLSRLRAFDAPAAEKLLSKAVATDPQFALAHSALAAAWSAMGYDDRAKAEAKKALDLSHDLSREEHLSISGRYWEMIHDWNKAVDTYRLLVTFFPDSLEYGLRLASAETAAGRGKEALSTLAKLRALRTPLGEDLRIDLAEAAAHEALGDFRRESELAEAAARKGEILGEDLLVARSLAKQAWALSRLGQTQAALENLKHASELFQAAGDHQGMASALRLMGYVLQTTGDYERAMQKNRQALAAFELSGDKAGSAKTLNNMAVVRYEQGRLEEANALFQRSLQIQIEVGSKINRAGVLGNIANILDAEGRLEEAQKLTEESVSVFREVGDQRALGTALGNLAGLRYERGDLLGAKTTYDDALKIKREIGYQRGIAYDLVGVGRVLSAEGDTQGARSREEEALAIRDRIGEKNNAAVTLVELAMLDLEEKKPAAAEARSSQAALEFEKDHSSSDEAAAYIVIARALLAQNRLAAAHAAVARALVLSRQTPSRTLHYEWVLASYETVAAKRPLDRAALIAARRGLESSLEEAMRCGYREYVFRIRFALGDLDIRDGNAVAGRASLETLSKDAGAAGFATVARRAAVALDNRSDVKQ